jgi:hypothetical protein
VKNALDWFTGYVLVGFGVRRSSSRGLDLGAGLATASTNGSCSRVVGVVAVPAADPPAGSAEVHSGPSGPRLGDLRQ